MKLHLSILDVSQTEIYILYTDLTCYKLFLLSVYSFLNLVIRFLHTWNLFLQSIYEYFTT